MEFYWVRWYMQHLLSADSIVHGRSLHVENNRPGSRHIIVMRFLLDFNRVVLICLRAD